MRTLVTAALAFVIFAVPSVAADKAKKKGGVVGKVKKVDQNTGTLTVTVKVKKVETDKEFKIDDATKVIVMNGDEKKELAGKEGLKSDQLKEGATVQVTADDDGKVSQLIVNFAPKKKKNK